MNTDELETVATRLRTIWPTIKIDIAWLTMLATSTRDLTTVQVHAGIGDLFDEGRDYPPNLSEIVHAARWRARTDRKWEALRALPAGSPGEGLRRYLERIGVSSLVEAMEYEMTR